jgi:PEP-CTERM motif-containing protein
MKSTFSQFSTKRSPSHGRRGYRAVFAALCVFLYTAVPALAEPIKVNQVVQTLTSSKGTLDLRLNTVVQQDPGTNKGGTQTGPRSDTPSTSGQETGKSDSVISGVTVTSEGQKLGVEIVEEGEVEGTICDCGEIFVAGGGFPKWPLLFLAAVPVVFIHDCDDCDENSDSSPTPTPTPTPTPPSSPTPTPTPPEVPEPASLLLFGTGIAAFGAGLRRRYARTKLIEQIKAQEDE